MAIFLSETILEGAGAERLGLLRILLLEEKPLKNNFYKNSWQYSMSFK